MIQERNPVVQKTPWPVVTSANLADNYGPGKRIKVRCIAQQGMYYDFLRRRVGDVFTLVPQYVTVIDPKTEKPLMENGEVKKRLVTAEEQFSAATMEKVDDDEPESVTTAQVALNDAQDKLNESKQPRRR